jgi:hypothetical protein
LDSWDELMGSKMPAASLSADVGMARTKAAMAKYSRTLLVISSRE